jgi:hypothetical protein
MVCSLSHVRWFLLDIMFLKCHVMLIKLYAHFILLYVISIYA